MLASTESTSTSVSPLWFLAKGFAQLTCLMPFAVRLLPGLSPWLCTTRGEYSMQQLLLATARLHVVQDNAALETCLPIHMPPFTCVYVYVHVRTYMCVCTRVHMYMLHRAFTHTAAHCAYVQVHLERLRVCEIQFRIWIQSSACQYDPRK